MASSIRPIREALDLYDLGGDPECAPWDTKELVAEADRVCRLIRATQIKAAAHALPPLIIQLTTVADRDGSSATYAALASAYRSAHDVCVKLGYYDLAMLALDRMDWAAHRASEPLLSAIRHYMRALVYFREGENNVGARLIRRGHEQAVAAELSTASLAVTGQLHLGASVLAARARDTDAVRTHISEASAYAQRVGEVGNIFWLSFGPTNVACHEVSVDVELHRFPEALEKAEHVTLPSGWATSRRAHFHLDKARSQAETGRIDSALASIMTARREAPQQTRYHPAAREVVRDLVRRRRTTPQTLDNLAAWIGL